MGKGSGAGVSGIAELQKASQQQGAQAPNQFAPQAPNQFGAAPTGYGYVLLAAVAKRALTLSFYLSRWLYAYSWCRYVCRKMLCSMPQQAPGGYGGYPPQGYNAAPSNGARPAVAGCASIPSYVGAVTGYGGFPQQQPGQFAQPGFNQYQPQPNMGYPPQHPTNPF
eukprot:scaffold3159_cov393-Prasinococcus_capsulatus_cf.AAC.9